MGGGGGGYFQLNPEAACVVLTGDEIPLNSWEESIGGDVARSDEFLEMVAPDGLRGSGGHGRWGHRQGWQDLNGIWGGCVYGIGALLGLKGGQ